MEGVREALEKNTCFPPTKGQKERGRKESVTVPYHTALEIAPYRDFEQWYHTTNGKQKLFPWHLSSVPDPKAKTPVKVYSRWFKVLRDLDGKLQMNLGLAQSTTNEKATSSWKAIPEVYPIAFNPVWSARAGNVKALRQWALRIVDASEGYMTWEPPTVERPLSSHRVTDLKANCECPESISVDPCLSTAEPVESWLSRRGPHYYLSKQRALCPRATKHNMHVLIPFRNATKQSVQSAVCSVACQNYPPEKINIIAYGDGTPKDDAHDLVCDQSEVIRFWPVKREKGAKSNDDFEVKVLEHVKTVLRTGVEKVKSDASGTTVVCIRSKETLGHAGATYWAFRFLEEYAGANDVVVVAEDGEFSTRNALEIINDEYVSKGAFFTYGGGTEPDGNLTSLPLPADIAADTSRLRPRHSKPTYRFGHPRTFKSFMLQSVTNAEFSFTDGKWLEDPDDRGYVFKMLEKAGVGRIGYISQPIFKHKESRAIGAPNTEHLKYVNSMDEAKKATLPLHVVMASSDNEQLMAKQIGWLQAQTIATKRLLVLHVLLDEQNKQNTEVESAVIDFKNERHGKDPGDIIPMEIECVVLNHAANDFAPFKYVKDLRRKEPMDFVVFLDSDQYWDPSLLMGLTLAHRSQSFTTWSGNNFAPAYAAKFVDFNKPRLSAEKVWKGEDVDTKFFTYGSLGSALLDTDIFTIEQGLLQRPDMPQDMWTSYVADALLGWDIRRLIQKLPVVSISQLNDANYANVVAELVPNDLKGDLMSLHKGMDVSGTVSPSQHSFEVLQSKYHWNVLRLQERPVRNNEVEMRPLSNKFTSPTKGKVRSKAAEKTGKRAFVCVTGQMSRLELHSKMENVFLPMKEAGFEIDVALVVSTGDTVFTNEEAKKSYEVPSFKTHAEAATFLTSEPNKVNVVSRDSYPKLADPKVPEQYVRLLLINQDFRTKDEQRVRAQNHARIFDSYLRCLEHADEAEAAARASGDKTTPYYDVFMRIRDDVGLMKPLHKNVLAHAFPPPPNSIVVTECRGWEGMNDRLAIVSPDIVRPYFELPYQLLMKSKPIEDKGAVRNPESYLLYTYTSAKIHVLGHPRLKGIVRSYKGADGTHQFLQADVAGDLCPELDPHIKRFHELYSWAV